MSHCIFKTKHIAHKATTTGLRCFFDMKHHALVYYPTITMKDVFNAQAGVYP